MTIDLLILNLPAIIILGLVTSYTDTIQGKIRNKHCMAAIIYGVVSLIIASLLLYQEGIPINVRYYGDVALNVAIGLFISFIIWNTGLLTAGDMKLFLAFSILVPLSAYRYGYVKFFPASTILVNTFVPLFIFIFFYILLRTSWAEKQAAIKTSLEPRRVGILAVATFGFSWVIGRVMGMATFLPNDYFTMILLVFVVIVGSEKLLKLSFWKVSIFLAVARIVFDFGNLLSLKPYLDFILLFGTILVIRIFVLELASKMFTKEIGLSELKEGMVLAEISEDTKDGFEGRKVKVFYDFVSYLLESGTNNKWTGSHSRQLTKEDLKRLRAELKGHERMRVRIHYTIPFAPFMFLGVVLTLILQGEAVGAINLLLRGIVGI